MNIDNSRKRYYLITLIFLVVITLFVISFFIFANRFVYQFATSIVLAIFLVFWRTTFYLRSLDKKLRRELLFIAGLELVWISLRIIKSFSYTTPVKNILWYLFYLPMIFMPSIWFIMIFDQRIKMAQ